MWAFIHILTVIFFLPALLITVPLHIIDKTIKSKEPNTNNTLAGNAQQDYDNEIAMIAYNSDEAKAQRRYERKVKIQKVVFFIVLFTVVYLLL